MEGVRKTVCVRDDGSTFVLPPPAKAGASGMMPRWVTVGGRAFERFTLAIGGDVGESYESRDRRPAVLVYLERPMAQCEEQRASAERSIVMMREELDAMARLSETGR